jgi:hypothetical protein
MATIAKHSLKLRYDGKRANNSELDLYDGATSIQGFAQALQIATHAYLNSEIVTRATAMRGAKMYMRPASKGSFLVEIVTIIEAYPAASGVATAIGAPVFYDFVKLVFRKATGLVVGQPDTNYMKKEIEKDEPFFDELAETLEGSLQRAHRPIGEDVDSVSIERPRSPLVTFNQKTKDWVNTREEAPRTESMTGNVTRFNSVTRNGRVFVKELGRIVPFKPDGDFPGSSLGLLTWSLHGSNLDIQKKLEREVRPVKSSSGDTKRLLLSDCKRKAATTV